MFLLQELKGFLDVSNNEDMDVMNLFAENEEDDTETETTSPDEGDKDESFKRKRKSIRMRNLEKMNMFMEENAPFPENTSPLKTNPGIDRKETAVVVTEKQSDEKQVKNPTNIEEAFKMAIEQRRARPVNKGSSSDNDNTFTSSRPQDSKFRYGGGAETNTVTRGHDQTGVSAEQKKGKDSTDETTSSDEILKTSSSVKTSSEDNDNKRKKGTLSPSSEGSSTIKPDDKKFKYGGNSDSSDKEKKSGSEDNTMKTE